MTPKELLNIVDKATPCIYKVQGFDQNEIDLVSDTGKVNDVDPLRRDRYEFELNFKNTWRGRLVMFADAFFGDIGAYRAARGGVWEQWDVVHRGYFYFRLYGEETYFPDDSCPVPDHLLPARRTWRIDYTPKPEISPLVHPK